MFIELKDGSLYNIKDCRKIVFKQENTVYIIKFIFEDDLNLEISYSSEETILKARQNLIKFIKEKRTVISLGDLINA